MAYIYEDNEGSGKGHVFRGRPVPYEDQDAVGHWARHFANSLMLDFLHAGETDGRERAGLRREMQICERKMEHWRKHRNWNSQAAAQAAEAERAKWNGRRT